MRILTAKNQGLTKEINTKRDLMVGSRSKSTQLKLEEYNGIFKQKLCNLDYQQQLNPVGTIYFLFIRIYFSK